MAIYMKLTDIDGPVQVSDFKDTIELTNFTVGASRHLTQPTRSDQNRGHAEADVDMVPFRSCGTASPQRSCSRAFARAT
jgi:hypothetical protein